MPIYEYACKQCEKVFEMLHTGSGRMSGAVCPGCGSGSTRRLFSRFGFVSGGRMRGAAGAGCKSCRPSPGKCSTCR